MTEIARPIAVSARRAASVLTREATRCTEQADQLDPNSEKAAYLRFVATHLTGRASEHLTPCRPVSS